MAKVAVLLSSISLAAAFNFWPREPTWADRLPIGPQLSELGEFGVGYEEFSITNPNQFNFRTNAFGDRVLNLGVWYPTRTSFSWRRTYRFANNDGIEFEYCGIANQFSSPSREGPFPLIVISHGLPGRKELFSGHAENFASKGYVVVGIDHTDSLVSEDGDVAFPSSALHRRGDILFTLGQIAALSTTRFNFLNGLVNVSQTMVIGYSFGGYGALLAAGATLSQPIIQAVFGPAAPVFEAAGLFTPVTDDRIKAVISLAPFGQGGTFGLPPLFDAAGLAGVSKPILFFGGDEDDISGYNGIRALFEGTTSSTGFLVTLGQCRHNIFLNGPPNAWSFVPGVTAEQFETLAEATWDKRLLNNVVNHFMTAFANMHIGGLNTTSTFVSENGVFPGFIPRVSLGFTVESK